MHMRFFIVFLSALSLWACKKTTQAPQVTNCNQKPIPEKYTGVVLEIHDDAYGLYPFPNGNLGFWHRDSFYIYDPDLVQLNVVPTTSRDIRVLPDNTFLTLSTSSHTDYVEGPDFITGWVYVGKQKDCSAAYLFADNVELSVMHSVNKTLVTRYDENGYSLGGFELEGLYSRSLPVVYGEHLYFGLLDKDTVKQYPVMDANGFFRDTIRKNESAGVLHFYKTTLSGAIQAHKVYTGYSTYMEASGEHTFFERGQGRLWFCTSDELTQLDMEGRLMHRDAYPKAACEGTPYLAMGFKKGIYIGSGTERYLVNASFTASDFNAFVPGTNSVIHEDRFFSIYSGSLEARNLEGNILWKTNASVYPLAPGSFAIDCTGNAYCFYYKTATRKKYLIRFGPNGEAPPSG